MFYWPQNIDEDLVLDFDEITKEVFIDPSVTQKEAYELNKTRETCIRCGARLSEKAVLATTIMYCPCVDQ